MEFRLVPKSMTLNHLERRLLTRAISVVSELLVTIIRI